ncbi:MAG: septum formation inhibitor Maf [Gammaproteobacteria bacterium]|nr:septum formation inhibitor Maf [Gammaproteobacteria bacterium]
MSVNSLVLASGSPRRFELLQLLDRPFTVVRPDVVEQRNATELPTDYVKRLALDKARAGVSLASADALVLGADTIVVADGQVLEKPTSFDHFVGMMQQLSGQTHQAVTAVAAVCQGIERVIVSAAKVTFKPLSSEEIADYWGSGEPHDKAGGYGIQGRAAKFVTHIEGSYFAVVGLPVYETEQLIVALINDIEGRP